MAKSKNSKQSDAVSAESLTRKENVRLIAGFSLVIFGIFLICSIISYLFYWKVDMSAINNVNPRIDVEFSNICGPMGARLAQKMVGGGFGLFAIIIPLFITVLGWRLFRFKSLRLYRFGLICALTLLMGSLTLGATFDTAWELFGSGLGGDYGLALNNWLTAHIGTIGTILVIVIGWISIGILINRNFLQLLGNWCVAGYERAMAYAKVEIAKLRDRRRRRDVEDEFEAETLAAEAAKVEEPVAEVAVSAEEPSKAVAVACDEDDIFVVQPRDDIETEEIVPEQEDVTEEVVMPAEEVTEPTPQPMSAPLYPEDDFYVVPRDEEEGGDVPVSHNAAANILGIEDSPAEGEGIVVTVTENGVKEVDEDDINSDLYDPMRDLH
ncbi:MAG: DNA translocase FtsK 4TM domain-containing protein, partial [Alistipes sp.]|nr:DNA translocase FtsK 4TM domain-containing protein [Alistipes sp.]